jgi:hypothetical protein
VLESDLLTKQEVLPKRRLVRQLVGQSRQTIPYDPIIRDQIYKLTR